MKLRERKPRVYLAGPGVFRPDAYEFGGLLKKKCARAGLAGCFPLNGDAPGRIPRDKAAAIYRANVELINSAVAVIADLSPFRGPNMDPGTAWEIGYAIAKGLPVSAWSTGSELLLARTQAYVGTHRFEGRVVDDKGWTIEDFDLADNLMIAISCNVIYKNSDEAIAACANAVKKASTFKVQDR